MDLWKNPNTQIRLNLTIKTLAHLETICSQELQKLGATNIKVGRRMISCQGDLRTLYRINLESRTALRVLVPIKTFTATSEKSLYHGVRDIEWVHYLSVDGNLWIDLVNQSKRFRNSHYLAQVCKDAIVDQFRSTTGKRPSVSKENPQLRLNVHIGQRGNTTLSIDSSGNGLHRRGYRSSGGQAPLNEVLAAGLLILSGYNGDTPFVDPFCGSGTLIAEAATMAARKAPGLNRRFGFEHWKNFDPALYTDLRKSLIENERQPPYPILAGDNDEKQLGLAKSSLTKLGLHQHITWHQGDFEGLSKPDARSHMVTNPPYEIRLETGDIESLYRRFGDHLKHHFTGCTAWILSGNRPALKRIGLRPSQKIALKNGPLDVDFWKFELY
ncbi:MAG: THUMP domain-containing protein [Bacteroidota bacterium]